MNAICAEHSCPARECEGVTLTFAVTDDQCAGLAKTLVWVGLIIGSWMTVVGPVVLVAALLHGR